MQGNEPVSGGGGRKGVSRLVLTLVLAPVLLVVGYLAWWSYDAGEWTWFALLLAAGIGLLILTIAPDLFSLGRMSQDGLLMPFPPVPPPTHLRKMERSTAASAVPAKQESKSTVPDRTA